MANHTAGRIFFGIMNGQKLLVGASNTAPVIKRLDQYTDSALWELIRNQDGYYNIRNKDDGQYIVYDREGHVLTKDNGDGERAKWSITLVADVSVDACNISPKAANTQVWANKDGKLTMAALKTSLEVTERADQLFELVYVKGLGY